MNEVQLSSLLGDVSRGEISVDDALLRLKRLPFEALEDFATLDHHRALRSGFPEVIFCQGKSTAQVAAIAERLAQDGVRLLGTRATIEQYEAARALVPDLNYSHVARALWLDRTPDEHRHAGVVSVCAGTTDLAVLEEANLTLRLMGHEPHIITDVGVSGLHRLFPHVATLQSANVVVCAAGMEGALASVIGGLVAAPVIAVPTSVGYGASFGGLAALLAMLNSCAAGVTVVNIDNGFGAGHAAALINTQIQKAHQKRDR